MFSKKLTGIFSIKCSTKTEAIDDIISDYEDGISRNISYQNISMKFIHGDGGLKKNINIYSLSSNIFDIDSLTLEQQIKLASEHREINIKTTVKYS